MIINYDSRVIVIISQVQLKRCSKPVLHQESHGHILGGLEPLLALRADHLLS